jgi:hypothetical protein
MVERPPCRAWQVSKIPDYLKEKTNEKIKLQQEIEKLDVQVERLKELRDLCYALSAVLNINC